MFKTILVATDGTERDDVLLTYVAQLARRMSAEVVLLRAALARAAPEQSPAEAHLEAVSAAELHLARLEHELRVKGIKVRSVVPYGDTAEAVVENAALLGADLLALAGGLSVSKGSHALADLTARLARAGLPIFVIPLFAPSAPADLTHACRCHNCGLSVDQPELTTVDRCPRCGYFLRACPNCQFYDGIICLMDNPQSSRRYQSTGCEDFRFRDQRLRADTSNHLSRPASQNDSRDPAR